MQRIHIVGICGTAMAAIAGLAKELGYAVAGSDAGVYPPMSDYLREQGIELFEGFDAARLDPAPDLVVIGNAISRGNAEVEAVLDRGIPYCSGPEFLSRRLLPGRHALVVAGTHGKTTTSSLAAHLLEQAGLQPGFMIGGVPENFGGGARLGSGSPFVLEGDEYDTAFFDKRSKFLHYHARTLILNNLEYDHADIFPDLAAIERQFELLLRTVPASGRIVVNADDANLARVVGRGVWTPVARFAEQGSSAEAEWRWESISADGSRFRLWHEGQPFLECEWNLIGRHNVANACAVAAAAHGMDVDAASMAAAFASFAGVRRRMTLVGTAGGVQVYDDFAHHPTAIAGVIAALKARMTGGQLWVLIEPRSNTMRTRVHQSTLGPSLRAADRVCFVPPTARSLKPEEMLDVAAICAELGSGAAVLPNADAIVALAAKEAKAGDRLLVLSNGSFDGIHGKLLAALAK